MNTIKNLISSNVQSQIPDFIVDEYPLFLSFIQTYYQGLERSGESIDLVNNFLDYLDIDFYQNNIKTDTKLSANISENDASIKVESTEGFPDVDGLIQINSEIILYKSKTSDEFLDCSRGVSGVTKIGNSFEYSYSFANQHIQNETVTNLSYLFLLYFFSKIKSQYLPNFSKKFVENLNVASFIKNIKQFYNVKGTSQSFDYLIRAFFNEKNETLYPREYIIKPSDAIYEKKLILKCQSISGNPLELVGERVEQIYNYNPCSSNTLSSYVYVESAEKIFDENNEIYTLTINYDSRYSAPELEPSTKTIKSVLLNDNKIVVDSTIGFPSSGVLKIDNEYIRYTDKTVNEFLNCTRGFCNTTPRSYEISSLVEASTKFYGYSNIDGSKIVLKILGIASYVEITKNVTNYYKNDIVKVDNLGFFDDTTLTKKWIFNVPKLLQITSFYTENLNLYLTSEFEHNLVLGQSIFVYGFSDNNLNGIKSVSNIISDTQFAVSLNQQVNSPLSGNVFISIDYKLGYNNIPADVINVYDQNNECLYIASAGVPSHSIGSGLSVNNQRYLKRIPRNFGTGSSQIVSSGDVGIFVNGVLAKSFVSNEKITYGEITNLVIENAGNNYSVGLSGGPSISITGNATATCKINGSVKEIYVKNGGTGFVKKPVVQITGGGGNGAQAEALISNGSIVGINVINSGTGYTSIPNISIIGGGGYGTNLVAKVTGPITDVTLTNPGSGYTSIPNVSINLGSGAVVEPIISNGKIVDAVVVFGGSGYTTPPEIVVNDSTFNGNGAKIIADVLNGSVTSLTVISTGINYTDGFTTLSVVPTGSGCIIRPEVRTWTYNRFLTENLDQNNGFSSFGRRSDYGQEYTYLANPKGLRRQLNDNINQNLSENTFNLSHSPLIGWAYDGNPIYGPYGYSDPLDVSSTITRITSGYVLNGSRNNGPSANTYPLGTFIEDYVYSSGMLDVYNGRNCVTPEFPNGTYAYFVTISIDGTPIFPYILGRYFKNTPDIWNFSSNSIQDNIPTDVRRYRQPYINLDLDTQRKIPNEEPFYFLQEDGLSYILQEDNQSYITGENTLEIYDYFPKISNPPLISVQNTLDTVDSKIDGFFIENPGENYRVNDRLIFENVTDRGYGASAKVSYVTGVGVTTAYIETFNKIFFTEVSGAFSKNSRIYGNTSGTGATVKYTTSNPNLIFTTNSGQFLKDEIITSDYISSLGTGISTLLLTNIGSGYTAKVNNNPINEADTTITLNNINNINVGDSLLINDEIVKVFSGSGNTLGIFRGIYGTTPKYYGVGVTVSLLPTINLQNSSVFDVGNYVKINNEVFRIVDINNSSNTVSVLRKQIGSSFSTHNSGNKVEKIFVSSGKYSTGNTAYISTLGTGISSFLKTGDTIKVSSGSTFDVNYEGTYEVLYTDQNYISYEINSFGTGYSGTLTYTTNSLTTKGSISQINLLSGGSFYDVLPKISVSSETGSNASILPLSNNSGKIVSTQIDNFGFNLNSDFTLKPELTFSKNLYLKNTLAVDKIAVIDGGSGYQYIPTVEISGGGGQGTIATAEIKNKKVVAINVIQPGYGYNETPTISVKKTFPCFINQFNSTINFGFTASESFATGDAVKIVTNGSYPVLFGGLTTNSSLILYAIVGGSLDSNQIKLALTASNANDGVAVQFASIGTGNIRIVSESGNAVVRASLITKDFQSGEIVKQYDNSDNVIAQGVVSQNYGWQQSTKILRLENITGQFSELDYRIIGEKSKATGFIEKISYAEGLVNVSSVGETIGKFVTDTGKISDAVQHIFDGNYYQNYSYSLKNNIDYNEWSSEIKNISHPSGFKMFGDREISSGSTKSSTPENSYLILDKTLYNDLSLSTYNKFAIVQPDYSTSLKDQITVLNRQLTSSEQIITSKVDRIDDISNSLNYFIGTGTTNQFYLNTRIKDIVRKDDLILTIDDIIQPIENYDLQFDFDNDFNITAAKVVTSNIVSSGSSIIVTAVGLNFDGINTNFPLTFNGLSKTYNNNQILITLNGVIQTSESYEITQKSLLKFNEVPYANGRISIQRVSTGTSSTVIVGNGSSTYGLGATFNQNGSFVVIDGILQEPNAYNISGNNIVFTEALSQNSVAYVRDFGSGISSKEIVGLGTTTNIIPITSNISSGSSNCIVSINGLVQNYADYSIGAGSTCIILNEQVSTGSSVFICNFNNNISYVRNILSNGNIAEYTLDENYSDGGSYIITLDGAVQIIGENYSYQIENQTNKLLNFIEPPKPRTKFFGLLYNRKDPSENAIIDDFSKSYVVYSNDVQVVISDTLHDEDTGNYASVASVNTNNKVITLTNINGNFSTGKTLISGISSGSTSLVTKLKYGSIVPSNLQRYQDAANIIRLNQNFIKEEAYGFIINKYPNLITEVGAGISKCQRDIGYFIDAITDDLEIGSNLKTIEYSSYYYNNYNSSYITNQIPQSQETFRYARDLAISAMRNWVVNIPNCSVSSGSTIVGVGTTIGLLLNMKISGTGIAANSTIVSVGNTFIRINNQANSTGTGITLNFNLASGKYSSITPVTQTVTIDNSVPSCSDVSSSIASLTDLYNNILSNAFSIIDVRILYAGSGYTNSSPPSVTIQSPGGSGVTALATATVGNDGTITDIVMTNIGSGYTFSPNITIASPSGSGVTAILSPSIGINVAENSGLISRTLSGTGTSITLEYGSGITINDYLLINGEAVKVTSVNDNYGFNIQRSRLGTTAQFHNEGSEVKKYIPVKINTINTYTGFNGTGATFSLTSGGNPYNYNGTPFTLPSSSLDEYGQDYSQSLISVLNGVIQDNDAQGSYTLSGDTVTFLEPPKEGFDFYGRYIGKLRRLNDISSQFNGTKLSFNMNIGNNLIYSIIPPDAGVDISNNCLIFINGVLQNPGDSFVILGSRIIFSEPPRPGSTFLGYVYIGSDEDVTASNILAPIEKNDVLYVEGEEETRNVLSVDSSSSLSTLGYDGEISGKDASATAIVSGGRVSSIQINNSGFGYFEPPVVIFRGGGGYGASATAVVNNGRVTNIIITHGGVNYTSQPNISFARNINLTKFERVRAEYDSTYRKITSLGTGLSFGSGTSLPATNQTVGIANTSGFNSSGSFKIIDNSRSYRVVELVTYNNISGTNLTGCVRGVGFKFNKILKVSTGTTSSFSLGQSITNGTGATGIVIDWDSTNKLLYVNKTSTNDFSNNQTIFGAGITILDAAFIRTYLSYGSGVTIIQIS